MLACLKLGQIDRTEEQPAAGTQVVLRDAQHAVDPPNSSRQPKQVQAVAGGQEEPIEQQEIAPVARSSQGQPVQAAAAGKGRILALQSWHISAHYVS